MRNERLARQQTAIRISIFLSFDVENYEFVQLFQVSSRWSWGGVSSLREFDW